MARLKSICRVIVDGDWIESKDQSPTGIRLIQTGNIGVGEYLDKSNRAKFISEETFARLKCTQVFPGDILVSRLPDPVGRACIVPKYMKKSIAAVDCTIVRLDDSLCDVNYFINYTQSARYMSELSKFLVGTTRTRISRKNFEKIEIPLPSLDEQCKIAAALDKVSDLIAKRRQQLDKLDLLVKSKFVEMFGDCKMNPKKWNICNLEEIAEVGSSKRVFVEELKETGIPFYRGTEVGALAEGKSITPELFITQEHYQELCQATGVPRKGDLLMPSICPDGRIWVVNSDEPFYFKDGRVLWVHNINERFNPIFLLYTLKDRIMTDYNSIASGTTFAELKIFSLKKCQIFDVSLELQNKFADFVEQKEKTKTSISQSLEKLETLKKALMQEYFG